MNVSFISENGDEDIFNLTNTSHRVHHITRILDNPSIEFAFYFVYSLVFALCVFGNLCVLIVVAVHWRMRNVPKFCMGNLAFANLCVGLFCIYQNLSTFLADDWIFGRLLCKMYYFTNSLSHTASIIILIVVCIERYLVILQPFRARVIITTQRLRLTVALVWIVSALICSPRLYYITTFETSLSDGKYEVICAPKRTLYNSRAADLASFILLFFIPLIVMTVLYARIGNVIWKKSAAEFPASIPADYDDDDDLNRHDLEVPPNSEATESYSSSSRQASPLDSPRNSSTRYVMNSCAAANSKLAAQVSSKLTSTKKKTKVKSLGAVRTQVGGKRKGKKLLRSRRSTIRMLIAIVVTFAICNFPYHLRKLCQYYAPNYNYGSYYNQILTPLSFLLMYSNCAINPILYACMSKSFRMSLRDLIRFELSRPNPTFLASDPV